MSWLTESLTDFRYGLNRMRREPGFTAAVVMALALGIGANTAIFTIARATLLAPLPYPHAGRIMMMWETNAKRGWDQFPASAPDFLDWRRDAKSFSAIAAFVESGFNLGAGGSAERVDALQVTDSFFDVMGIQPRIGRAILPEDVRDGGAAVAVLGDALWKRSFGADEGVVGRKVDLDGRSFTVIGVLPANFGTLTNNEDLYLPLAFSAEQLKARNSHSLVGIGRLKEGVSVEAGRAEMASIAARLAKDYPDTNSAFSATLIPFAEEAVQDIKPLVLILWGTVGVVLLIACVNVANLLLARGQSRRREFAIRLAIGARRWRLTRQLLTESTLLALIGGGVGLLPAIWGTDLLARAGIEDFPTLQEVRPDFGMVWFALAVAVASGVLFGIIPAWNLARTEVGESLKNANSSLNSGWRRHKARGAFIVAEVALSLMLLLGAGLLLRSLYNLKTAGPGFQPGPALALHVKLAGERYATSERIVGFADRVLQEARALPGVEYAAAGDTTPLTTSLNVTGITFEKGPAVDSARGASATRVKVSPDYFRALGIPIRRGRAFQDSDRAGAAPVAIIDETFARRYFPGQDPVGKRVRFAGRAGAAPEWVTIAGVAGDVRASRIGSQFPGMVYSPLAQSPEPSLAIVVRASVPPAQLAEPLRKLIAEVDPNEAVYQIRTMDQIVASSIAPERVATILVTGFASLAVALALMGISSVVSYAVTSRTRELGIRMALGAQSGDVLSVLMRQALVLVSIGIALGTLGAFALSRLLESLLHEISPTDPATFGATLIVMAATAALASLIPARRALRLDPLTALRQD